MNELIPSEELSKVVARLQMAREAESELRTCSLEELAQRHGLSRKTLYTIRKAATEGPEALARKRENRPGPKPGIHQKALAWALAYKEAHPRAKMTSIREKLMEANLGCSIPSYYQLTQAFARDFKELVSMMEVGYKEFFDSQVIKLRRAYGYVNEVWQIDASDSDCYAFDLETGKLIRPWILSCIDGYSRTVAYSMVLKKEPTAEDLMRFLICAFLAKGRSNHPFMGVPLVIIPDQHSIFKSGDFVSAMLQLNVRIEYAPKDVPQGKAIQERWFRTLKDGLMSNLISYAEKSNAMGKAQTAAIPFPLMQKLVDDWLVKYHLRDHSTLGFSPWEKFHEGLAGAYGLNVPEKDVRMALRVRVEKTIHEDGIELEDGLHYVSSGIVGLLGKTVTVLKPLEIGTAPIHAYYRESLISEIFAAEGNPTISSKVASARLERIEVLREIRRDLRKALKMSGSVEIPAVNPSAHTKTADNKRKNPTAGKSPGRPRKKIPKLRIESQD